MKYKILGEELRLLVRGEARTTLLQIAKAGGSRQDAIDIATVRVRMMAGRYCRQNRGKFGSIVTIFLVNLAVKLAVALIIYWLDGGFNSPPAGGFIKGEPGA